MRMRKNSSPVAPNGLRWTIPWGKDAELETLIFDDFGSRWIFSHRFRLWQNPEDRSSRRLHMLNELRLVVDYAPTGKIVGVELSMHVILPERLGQKYLYGMDVSPGAKTYFTFEYEIAGDERGAPVFRLKSITRGCRDRVDLDATALLKQVSFPFPVPDRLVAQSGYEVPYVEGHGPGNVVELGSFRFPATVAG